MDQILNITDLWVSHHDGTQALRGVDLELPAGSRLGLVGPNGAGKTSLLLAVMGALPFRGRIAVDGLTLNGRNTGQIRSRCGMTFQDAEDQLFMPTLLDDVAFGPLNQGLSPDQANAHSDLAIGAVGLAGLEGRCAHHLSGGQKRCAALATVLSMRVKLLLLDEPGANLDHRSRGRIIQLLAGRPESMVLASHDLDMISILCDLVAVLDDGKVVAAGPAGRILSDESLLRDHGLK